MSAKRDYYDVLGVSRGADGAAIKKLTENWQKSTIRTVIQATHRRKKDLKRLQKLIMY